MGFPSWRPPRWETPLQHPLRSVQLAVPSKSAEVEGTNVAEYRSPVVQYNFVYIMQVDHVG
jgi:hypothetical protein